ncbi:MAG: serine/threonine protein kinase [Actinomycetaceae bacterium]|nr:serine/threonine protein kinase [Actinomycetaceae bacterium]
MAKRLPSTPPTLSGFTPVRPLGTGGFADVFLYEQNMPRRTVAVKVLLADVVDDDVVRMFNAEADTMARLSSHPSILTVYEAAISPDGRPYLVMEYCPRSISPAYRSEVMPLEEVLDIAVRIGAALETAHRAGVLHRDIKPSNILYTSFGTPVLADFGIATSLSGRHGNETFAMSVPWSAPEVLTYKTKGTVATEVYSLGATIYSLLAGHSPYELAGSSNAKEALRKRVLRGKMTPLDRDDVTDELMRTLLRSLSNNPENRQSSALEFAREIQAIQKSLDLPVSPLEVVDEEWAGAGAVLAFADDDMRGANRAVVPHESTRRSHGTSVAQLAQKRAVDELPESQKKHLPTWAWGLITAGVAAAAAIATMLVMS